MIEKENLELAYTILQQMGYKRISYDAKPFDLQAEKDGTVYDVMLEVGENQSIEVAWQKLTELVSACIRWKDHKALLMLMTDSGVCLFEMLDGRVPPEYYRPWAI
jgi:hypothetical protein